MERMIKAAGILVVAMIVSMIVVAFLEGMKALIGVPVTILVALAISAGLCWSLAKMPK